MILFKIIGARIRTTKTIHTVLEGNKFKGRTEVTYRPQVQYKFLGFTWWDDVCCIECSSYSFALVELSKYIKDNSKVTETNYEYEYFKI